MRKFWVILLTMGLIMALAMPVAAADVKFSGSYVAQGYYESNPTLKDPEGGSQSFGWQRLRVDTTVQVVEGLKLVTSADIMEKVWGATRSATATSTSGSTANAEMENIKFMNAYVDFAAAAGAFRVGYQTQGNWATAFGDTGEDTYGFRIRYDYMPQGPVWLVAIYDKVEGTKIYGVPNGSDGDGDKYSAGGAYKWTGGEAGILITYYLYGYAKADTTAGWRRNAWAFQPYMKGKFGPVFVEAEVGYGTGKYTKYNDGSGLPDVKWDAWRAYVMAVVDLAPAYVGIGGFYTSGDSNPSDDTKKDGLTIGNNFSPCLIAFNYDLGRFGGNLGTAPAMGSHGSNNGTAANSLAGVQAIQLRVGVKPIPKLDAYASVSYARLDKNPGSYVSKELGYEADVVATYKIYDNLSYMIGFGYLFAGDAFKGTSDANKIKDDYLVTHKLTLTF